MLSADLTSSRDCDRTSPDFSPSVVVFFSCCWRMFTCNNSPLLCQCVFTGKGVQVSTKTQRHFTFLFVRVFLQYLWIPWVCRGRLISHIDKPMMKFTGDFPPFLFVRWNIYAISCNLEEFWEWFVRWMLFILPVFSNRNSWLIVRRILSFFIENGTVLLERRKGVLGVAP